MMIWQKTSALRKVTFLWRWFWTKLSWEIVFWSSYSLMWEKGLDEETGKQSEITQLPSWKYRAKWVVINTWHLRVWPSSVAARESLSGSCFLWSFFFFQHEVILLGYRISAPLNDWLWDVHTSSWWCSYLRWPVGVLASSSLQTLKCSSGLNDGPQKALGLAPGTWQWDLLWGKCLYTCN